MHRIYNYYYIYITYIKYCKIFFHIRKNDQNKHTQNYFEIKPSLVQTTVNVKQYFILKTKEKRLYVFPGIVIFNSFSSDSP